MCILNKAMRKELRKGQAERILSSIPNQLLYVFAARYC